MKNNNVNKKNILEQLKKIPIIETACQKVGVSRMTLFRWKKEDKEFAQELESALCDGKLLINDLAENQLVGSIKDRNLSAVQYWLKFHHPDYANKLQIQHEIYEEDLSPEQKEIVRNALKLAGYNQDEFLTINQQEDEKQQCDSIGISGENDNGQESKDSTN